MKRRSMLSMRFSAIAVGMLASGLALAEARLDPALVEKLGAVLPSEPLEVVIAFAQDGPLTAAQRQALETLGIRQGVQFHSLPIAGALATPAQVQALAARDDVTSIYLNHPLRYFNAEARQISGVERLQAAPQDFGRAIPYTGAGVTAVINDSGIDATHADLSYGSHVVENVQGLTNLRALFAFGPVTYLEGQYNTDTNSGHGTHCAGSFGGTGARSGGLYRGVAPGADIVGYGSGGGLFILDAIGGFDYAITHQFSFDAPIRVISNSWGSSGRFDPANPVNIASYAAYKRGITAVFAAGNDGPGEDTHNPYAQAPWVISVGAGTKDGRLVDFSSRGKRGESGTFTMHDGREWTYVNEPTIVATGVDVVSTRASTNLTANGLTDDLELAPEHLPFYTMISGTSMATPHVAGIVALMLEANPALTSDQIKDILRRTATNMTAHASWEVGAGHVDAYAAVAEAAGLRSDHGRTVNALRSFNSNALLKPGASMPFAIDFSPVGPTGSMSFEVGPQTAWITARAVVDANTVAVVLIDPDGERYGSSIALPLLGDTVVASAPAKPGTWTLTVRGFGSVSGVALDPLRVTNGYGAPGTIEGTLSFLDSAGFSGLDDVAATHPARGAIELGVSRRLVDGYSDRKFRPDQTLRRSELAQYLTMGANLRQRLPLAGVPSFPDLSPNSFAYPFAEAAVARGAVLRNLGQDQDGPMQLINGAFRPNHGVTRLDLAYALVQSLALQDEARAFSGELSAFYDGKRVPLKDADKIPAALRGYVQLALDAGVINARFALEQGPFDLQPKLVAYFDPTVGVTRAAYAVAAGRFAEQYRNPRP